MLEIKVNLPLNKILKEMDVLMERKLGPRVLQGKSRVVERATQFYYQV